MRPLTTRVLGGGVLAVVLAATLAARVGATGQVWANDVQPQMLDMLARRLATRHLTNVTLVQGTIEDPTIPVRLEPKMTVDEARPRQHILIFTVSPNP